MLILHYLVDYDQTDTMNDDDDNLFWVVLQANYVIPAFMCVMILLIFQIPAYVSSANLPSVIALFLMYG